MTEPALFQQVITRLHLDTTESTLEKEVTATPESNSELVDVVVHDPSPVMAARIANAVITTYVSQVNTLNARQINQAGASLQAQLKGAQATLAQEEQQLVAAEARRQGYDGSSSCDCCQQRPALTADVELQQLHRDPGAESRVRVGGRPSIGANITGRRRATFLTRCSEHSSGYSWRSALPL